MVSGPCCAAEKPVNGQAPSEGTAETRPPTGSLSRSGPSRSAGGGVRAWPGAAGGTC